MTSAHGATLAGGPQLEVLIVAAGMLILGIVLFVQKTAKPAVVVLLLVAAVVTGGVSFAVGDSAPDVTVAITSPHEGARVPAGKPVDVRFDVQGGTLTSGTEATSDNSGHVHVFVDDSLEGMPSDTRVPLELEPGRHTIMVEFTASDHHSFSPRITDKIEVIAR